MAKSKFDEQEMIDKASRLYGRYCDRNGFTRQEPATASSRVEGGIVILENVNGVLARYRITQSGGLRMLA
jgi:hypothetical protein